MLSDINTNAIIDKILNKQARSITDTGEHMKYRDLIESSITKLTTIERNDDQIISEYDFSSHTITQLLERGYQRGLETEISDRVRFIDVIIECGIAQERKTKILSTPDAKKVESAFEEAIHHIASTEQLKQLQNVKSFVEWCDGVKRDLHEIININ
jgi:hypothetical protein